LSYERLTGSITKIIAQRKDQGCSPILSINQLQFNRMQLFFYDYKLEVEKWTIEDELLKLDKQIQQSRTAQVL